VIKVISTFIAILFVALSINAAQARITIKETTKYYNIRAKTAQEVLKQIDRKGLMRRGRRHAVATTFIKMRIDNVKIRARGRRCSVKDVRVKLTLVYSYPRWRNIKQSSNSTRKKWNTYYKQIVQHEKKHGALAKKLAQNVERSARKITSRSSRKCAELTRKLKRSFKKLNRQHDSQQAAFDKREHHRTSHIMKLARSFAYSN
jgi:predicted secreted Zn-dependent protease